MERVKNLNEIKVRGDMLLVECFEASRSGIIIPASAGNDAASIDYMKVLVVGNKIDDVNVGDIVIDTDTGLKVSEYTINDKKRLLAVVQRHVCRFIVSPDNFDLK